MSIEQNKAMIRRLFEEGFNKRDWHAFESIMSPEFINYDMPMPQRGPVGFRAVVEMFTTAFPDMAITIDELIGEGDLVMTRGTFTGTNTGSFMNMPPTGRQVNVKYIDIWRIRDGLLMENWVRLDELGMMRQLGLIPG